MCADYWPYTTFVCNMECLVLQSTWDCSSPGDVVTLPRGIYSMVFADKPPCLLGLRISFLTSLDVTHSLPFPGGQIHWSQTSSKPRPSTSPWSQSQSLNVELTAYILLALLSKPNVTRSDLATASGVVAWLTRQQNAYGGFASTQVTVGWGRGCRLRKSLCTIHVQYTQIQTLLGVVSSRAFGSQSCKCHGSFLFRTQWSPCRPWQSMQH